MRQSSAPAARVREIRRDAGAEHRDRAPMRGERAFVRRAVDSLRESGDHENPRFGAGGRELPSDAVSVWRHPAGADDAHRAPRERIRVAVDPERIRRTTKIEKPARITRIGGTDADHGSERSNSANATSSARTLSHPARSAAVRATRRTRW